ncbi:SnoaL-like domain-containing protein [Mesorhizobium sp. WSM1497]|uniref:SnoaL-like domain-containing protein n=1 Tax=Mesorhizobium sp. WSM1497 TaxID=278153 RepID=UPI0032AF9D2D
MPSAARLVSSNSKNRGQLGDPRFPRGRGYHDITPKATGERVTMDEVGLYTVKNGKITEERFYY